MTILVTCGARFIASNFVLYWLAQSDEPIVNLDAPTYAGNLVNLAALAGDAHVFMHGDIRNCALVDELLSPTARAPALLLRPSRLNRCGAPARRTFTVWRPSIETS